MTKKKWKRPHADVDDDVCAVHTLQFLRFSGPFSGIQLTASPHSAHA